jgi:arylformamidase
LRLNRNRISVLGHSAAGQLAAVLASTDWSMENVDQPLAGFHSWIGVSGFYEIEPLTLTEFQLLLRFSPEDYQRWNPMKLVKIGMPPALLITGSEESSWLHEMCDAYAQELRNVGAKTQVLDAAIECHFSVLSRIGEPNSTLHRAVLEML